MLDLLGLGLAGVLALDEEVRVDVEEVHREPLAQEAVALVDDVGRCRCGESEMEIDDMLVESVEYAVLLLDRYVLGVVGVECHLHDAAHMLALVRFLEGEKTDFLFLLQYETCEGAAHPVGLAVVRTSGDHDESAFAREHEVAVGMRTVAYAVAVVEVSHKHLSDALPIVRNPYALRVCDR